MANTGERLDDEVRYRAVQSRDGRFDGWFFVAVTSTGIYCRPSCASVLPRQANVRFFPTAAAAQRAGFRACKRCQPEAVPGSPQWDRRNDVVARAMRAIADGAVDREGVDGLAARLGYSPRQLRRLLLDEVGAGPLELARAQRAQAARVLIETTGTSFADVAFAAGFGSVRQFNDTVLAVFGRPPKAMRALAARRAPLSGEPAGHGPSPISLRLAYRPPLAQGPLWGFLAARAVAGVEEATSSAYRRSLRLPHGAATVSLTPPAPGQRHVQAVVRLEDLRDLCPAVKRARQLLDLDSDPAAVADVLGPDPVLGPLLAAVPGLRTPGHVDGGELAVRAVLGQQVSVERGRQLASTLASRYGEVLAHPDGGVSVLFPASSTLAALSPDELPLPGSRGRCLVRLAGALASGEVDLSPGADREEAALRLLAIPGIGPWTVAYVRMRGLADPDAWPGSDLVLRRALQRLGLPGAPAAAGARAERWRPYRAYAAQYLWSTRQCSHEEDAA